VPLVTSSQGIDTSDDNPAGRLQLGVLMAVAEFERGIIKERVNAGLAAAKARGVQLGRPATINGRAAEVQKLKANPKIFFDARGLQAHLLLNLKAGEPAFLRR
jgi:DNA invertase Pin-like site-specific DNA recombinase